MKTLQHNSSTLILCVLEALIGILLLINPVGFTSAIIMGCGLVLVLMGTFSTLQYFRQSAEDAALSQSLFKGLIFLSAGAFCIFNTDWFLVTFPILTVLYGLMTFVSGLGKIQWTVDLFRLKKEKWMWGALSAAVSIVCAVIILRSPFTTTAVLWTFTGISMIAEAGFDAAALIISTKSH